MVTNRVLVREFAQAVGLSVEDAQLYIDALSKIILDSVCDGHQVDMRGLGSFVVNYEESPSPLLPSVGSATEESAEAHDPWSARFVFSADAKSAIKRSLRAHELEGLMFFSDMFSLGD